MGTDICFLVTVLNANNTILQCALRLDKLQVPNDCQMYPMEHRDLIALWLPKYVSSIGPIVNVERIFSIHTIN